MKTANTMHTAIQQIAMVGKNNIDQRNLRHQPRGICVVQRSSMLLAPSSLLLKARFMSIMVQLPAPGMTTHMTMSAIFVWSTNSREVSLMVFLVSNPLVHQYTKGNEISKTTNPVCTQMPYMQNARLPNPNGLKFVVNPHSAKAPKKRRVEITSAAGVTKATEPSSEPSKAVAAVTESTESSSESTEKVESGRDMSANEGQLR
mmetsp:Transcript_136378/g.272017  ORF Transcript_136378/g.272017 Transcript_136378/m.272017 type:complete len:203 (-) Transcript_136378:59-667(-)